MASNAGIGERGRELPAAPRVVAGEVPGAAQEARLPRHVVPRGQDPEAGLEALAIERARRRDDGDAIARARGAPA